MKHQFRIEKTRVYRAFTPEQGIPFVNWFYTDYLNGVPYNFKAFEDESYIQFRIESKADVEKERVRLFLLRILTQFKERFIQIYLSELQAIYVDPEHKQYQATQDFLNRFLFNYRGEQVRSLYSVFKDIKDEFMTFDLMILPPDTDSLHGTERIEIEEGKDTNSAVQEDFFLEADDLDFAMDSLDFETQGDESN